MAWLGAARRGSVWLDVDWCGSARLGVARAGAA